MQIPDYSVLVYESNRMAVHQVDYWQPQGASLVPVYNGGQTASREAADVTVTVFPTPTNPDGSTDHSRPGVPCLNSDRYDRSPGDRGIQVCTVRSGHDGPHVFIPLR